jgi:mannose PTS system EIIA component
VNSLHLGKGEAVIGIVIVAHGGLAREYLAAVEHVVGRQSGIRAISIEYDHDRTAKQDEIRIAADEVDEGHGVLVVTDMFGGSPSNLSMPACTAKSAHSLRGQPAHADQTGKIAPLQRGRGHRTGP